MLRSLKEIFGYRTLGLDEPVGSVHDFLFDGVRWRVRYLVIDTREVSPAPGVKVVTVEQARRALTEGPAEASDELAWALEARLGVLRGGDFIPFATATPELIRAAAAGRL